jgi:hypothetical protein
MFTSETVGSFVGKRSDKGKGGEEGKKLKGDGRLIGRRTNMKAPGTPSIGAG